MEKEVIQNLLIEGLQNHCSICLKNNKISTLVGCQETCGDVKIVLEQLRQLSINTELSDIIRNIMNS